MPYSPRSTSRHHDGDRVSGIRLYRIPAGVKFPDEIKFPELGIEHVDILQRHHRHVSAWPSKHCDTGQLYEWLDIGGQPTEPPHYPGDIPELPAAWLEALRKPEPAPQPVNGTPIRPPTGEIEPWFQKAIDEEIASLANAPYGRREKICNNVCLRLFRLHLAGGFPYQMVVDAVWAAGRMASANGPDPFTDDQIQQKLDHCWDDAQALGPATDVPELDVTETKLDPPGQMAGGDQTPSGAGEPLQVPVYADRVLTRSALRDLPDPEPLIENTLDQGTTALLYGKWAAERRSSRWTGR